MHVLVTYASRHHATAAMAQAIAEILREPAEGLTAPTVDVLAVDDVDVLDDFDAVVLGSSVYMGRWLKPARRFARENSAALAARPLWLFSSGPIGDPPAPTAEATDMSALAESLGARGSRTFAGRLRTAELGLGERATVRLVRAADGDYRDWDEIRAWAADIARALAAPVDQ